ARPEAGEEGVTQSNVAVGTLHYIAPEQASGGRVDHRADLFSLGCVLYRMSTGRLPFPGANLLNVLWNMNQPPPAPAALCPEVPEALSALILRLLERDPERRPATARAVAEELAGIEAELAAGDVTARVRFDPRPVAPTAPRRKRPSRR